MYVCMYLIYMYIDIDVMYIHCICLYVYRICMITVDPLPQNFWAADLKIENFLVSPKNNLINSVPYFDYRCRLFVSTCS